MRSRTSRDADVLAAFDGEDDLFGRAGVVVVEVEATVDAAMGETYLAPRSNSLSIACWYTPASGRFVGDVNAVATWSTVVVSCPPKTMSRGRACPLSGPMSYQRKVNAPGCRP